MDEVKLLSRKLEREQAARREAESILENKSLQLHESKVAIESAAKVLHAQNVRIQAIVDSAAEGIVTLDFGFCVVSFNPSAERIFKTSAKAVIGQPFFHLIDDLDPTAMRRFMDSEETRQDPKEYKTTIAGEKTIVEVTTSKTVGDDSSSMIVIVRDRTKSKLMESQLEIARKMESIGQMAAGIAHEINSPMQYVSDNTRFLKEAFADIESLLRRYQDLIACVQNQGDADSLIATIETEYEEADLDFTLEEVPQAIEQTIVGAERVSKIVQAMKVFSHPGETSITEFNLNDSIQSTVDVSKNEWKYVAEIDLDLEEDLPSCFGYPSKLNQAWLNLVVNGAHAIGKRMETETDHQGVIRISTKSLGDTVELEISDNGCGIPADQINRVFDPFFTTKPVGKGTGQGLSITHSIVVETHGGKIKLESEVGVGTTFRIQLPIQVSSSAEDSAVLTGV